MCESNLQLMRLAGLILTTGIAFAVQVLSPHADQRGSWGVNGPLWGLNTVMLAIVCADCLGSVALRSASAGIGVLHVTGAPLWVRILVTIAFLDFVSYLWHRANHRFAFLWRFHRVHHSDTSFTVTTGLRFHPGELLMSLPLRLIAVAFIGAPVAGVVAFEIVFNLANLVEHGNISLPVRFERRLAYLFVTPALHRRHHTRRRPDLDSNYATIFTWWDRLLGTYGENTSAARIDIGAPGIDRPLSLLHALALPFRTPPNR